MMDSLEFGAVRKEDNIFLLEKGLLRPPPN